MEANSEQPQPAPIDARTRLRIVSVELNEVTAELYKSRHDVLYRRLRVLPARRHVPAWAVALIVGGVGAAIGAIPAVLVRGDNLVFVFVAVCAAYTILAPATMLLLADQAGEDDANRLDVRERALREVQNHRQMLEGRVKILHEQLAAAREALRSADDADQALEESGRPGD
jgi:hypothetical protein